MALKQLTLVVLASFFASSLAGQAPDVCGSSRGRLSDLAELKSLDLMDGPHSSSDLQIDLTGDGLDEYLRGHLCGNAVCNYVIFFQEEPGKYRCLGEVSMHPKGFIRLVEKHSDFYDLLTFNHMSAETGSLKRLQFDGRKYQVVHKLNGKSKDLFPFVEKHEAP